MPGRNIRALLILGDKAEVCPSRQIRIRDKSACRRIDPATARNETGVWIVNHHQRIKSADLIGCSRLTAIIRNAERHQVDSGSVEGMRGADRVCCLIDDACLRRAVECPNGRVIIAKVIGERAGKVYRTVHHV